MTFSTIEKENIYASLIESCEKEWCEVGYRKTKIDSLCFDAGISKGSFYLFFSSKEDIFCEVLLKKQQELTSLVKKELGANPKKEDLARGLKNCVPFVCKITVFDRNRKSRFYEFYR